MQTFLVSNNFVRNAAYLDNQRLGKQRVESKQITIALEENRGFIHHPATKMWADHIPALAAYSLAICNEWTGRGYQDSLTPFFESRIEENPVLPEWLTDPVLFDRLSTTHMASLYNKDSLHYVEFAVAVDYARAAVCCDRCTTLWPTHLKENTK